MGSTFKRGLFDAMQVTKSVLLGSECQRARLKSGNTSKASAGSEDGDSDSETHGDEARYGGYHSIGSSS